MKRPHGILLGTGFLLALLAAATGAQDQAGSELVQMVVRLLGDQDKDVRSLGLEQVRGGVKGAVATRKFAAQLAQLAPAAQVGLLKALADRGDSAARPELLKTIASSHNPAVRDAAIRALGSLGKAEDLSMLMKLLASGPKTQHAAARASLTRLSGDTVSAALAAALKTEPPDVDVILIQILAERQARDTIPTLLSAAMNAEPTVRTAAMAALGQLAGTPHLAGMLRGVLKAEPGRERAAAEKQVMLVCQRIGGTEQRCQPLLAAMATFPEADQLALLPTLGRVGGSAALHRIEMAIADSNPKIHEIGIQALCNWPNAKIAPRLIELVDSDTQPQHRLAALRALIRVAPLPGNRPAAEKLELLQKAMAMATRDRERRLVLQRAAAIRTIETLRFVLPYVDNPRFAQQACKSIVELAHHRGLREPHKAEFHLALDKVIQTSQDTTVLDRAQRYKRDQTWVRPKRSTGETQ